MTYSEARDTVYRQVNTYTGQKTKLHFLLTCMITLQNTIHKVESYKFQSDPLTGSTTLNMLRPELHEEFDASLTGLRSLHFTQVPCQRF
jgi:hypothetical protein